MKDIGKSAAALFLCISFGVADSAAAQVPQKAPLAPPRKNEQRTDPLGLLLRQAEDAIEKKDYAAALQPLQSYLAQCPEDATVHFHLGYVYSGLERWEDAKSEYSKAIALNPKLAAAHLNLGLALLDREPAAAVEPLRQAADLLPDQSRPRFLLALALERTGNLVGAIEQYQTAQQLDGKNFEIRFALGRTLLAAGHAAEAEVQFRQSLALRGNSPPARLGLAESLRVQKRLKDAAEEFADYLQFRPQDHDSHVQLVTILMDLKRYDQALEELDRTDAGAQASVESYKLRAEIYLQQKQLTQAAVTLQKALQLVPQDAELHARLGRLWLENREFAPAERELRKALQLEPNWTDALRDLVAVYYLSQNYAATLDALDLLVQRGTPNAGSWFVRAICNDKLGRKAEALAAYEKFLALDQGRSENQDFQARQRIRLLTHELQQKKR